MMDENILDDLLPQEDFLSIRTKALVRAERSVLGYFLIAICLFCYNVICYASFYLFDIETIWFFLAFGAVLLWRKVSIKYDERGRSVAFILPRNVRIFRFFLITFALLKIFFLFSLIKEYFFMWYGGMIYEQYAFSGDLGIFIFYIVLTIFGAVSMLYYYHHSRKAYKRVNQLY